MKTIGKEALFALLISPFLAPGWASAQWYVGASAGRTKRPCPEISFTPRPSNFTIPGAARSSVSKLQSLWSCKPFLRSFVRSNSSRWLAAREKEGKRIGSRYRFSCYEHSVNTSA